MADTQYMDILNDVLRENDWRFGSIYPDGDGCNEEIFLYESYGNEIAELNTILKERLKAKGIDTYPDYDREDYYVDFVTGYNWGYSDSYYICDDCGKAFRYPEYGTANYWTGDGFIICEDCVKENYKDEYIAELINNPQKANVLLNPNELEELGFIKLDGDYENGFYGVEDKPQAIYDRLKNDKVEIIFHVGESNPFAIYFSAWVRPINGEQLFYSKRDGIKTLEEMKEFCVANFDYGDETNAVTYMEEWWKEYDFECITEER